MNRGFLVALALIIVSRPALGETALEMQSWCRHIASAPVLANDTVYVGTTFNDGVCWGSFAAIQQLSRIVDQDGITLLRLCPPPDSTRVQFIKIFMRYAVQHPEEAHHDFARLALLALVEAFPCSAQ
jgi:hypothetical protein